MQKLFKQVNIYYMYTRYVINTWIIQYSRTKQMSLLNNLLGNTMFLLKFIASILVFLLITIVSFILLQKRQCSDLILCEMAGILKLLKKEGFQRRRGETMSDFLHRVEENKAYSDLIRKISGLYHLYKYGKDKNEGLLAQLRASVFELKRVIKNG